VDENGHSTLAFAKAVVSHAETNGLDKKKVSLGIPFYARGDKKTRRFKDVKTYADLAGVVAHLPVDAVFNGYTLDSVSSVTAKTRWALEAGAGGITIWELGQDLSFLDENSLLRAVAGAVWPDGRPKPPSRQKPSFASGEF
jgi:GH18 family chitinase